jgi:hypothetical protein
MMTPQEMLKQMIDKAWLEFAEIAKEEEEDDYGDAMLSMERTHAEGYAEGLSSAYSLIFNEEYLPVIEVE